MFEALVHVVRNRAHVVEEFRIHGPALVAIEHRLADQPRPGFGHGVAEHESLAFEEHIAQPFVGRAIFVGRFGGAGEPTLVDAAAMGAEGIPIVGMQLDPFAGMQEAAGNPSGREPQQALAGIEGAGENRSDVMHSGAGLEARDEWKAADEASGVLRPRSPGCGARRILCMRGQRAMQVP